MRRPLLVPAFLSAAVLVLAACGSDDGATTDGAAAPAAAPAATTATTATTAAAPPVTEAATTTTAAPELPTVVVTYSILGAVVGELLDGAANVHVIIPNGQDPHDYAPSAKDVETIRNAALVVANGMGLEEQLAGAIEEAEAAGVPVFHATDHVTLRTLAEGGGDGHDHGHGEGEGEGEGEGGKDPHFWTSPAAMKEITAPLADALTAALEVDLTQPLANVQTNLDLLDAGVRSALGILPEGACKLVTGHESLGYFADRYGCELVGAIIPSFSSTAEASARELAELRRTVEAEGVTVIFTEVGTSPEMAEQLAKEAGVVVRQLPSHALPEEGGYGAFIADLARRIVDGLSTA